MLDAEAEVDLLCGLLARGERIQLKAQGMCMSPWIFDGDMITVSPVARPLRLGSIVLIRQADRLFAHRVVRFSGRAAVVVQGDSLDEQGVSSPLDQVLGEVTAVRHRCGITFDPGRPALVWLGWLTAPWLRRRARWRHWLRQTLRWHPKRV
ncbi:MAG: S24/S26 family peptidase [Bradymonadales bacterium]|nr:S24/S26 family peptidase [Bradymonadales bacterium]